MTLTYLVHILTGGLGMVAGFFALYSTKGAALHRRSGMVFVYAMLTMAVFGMIIAAVRGVAPAINIPAAALTLYLVVTGLMTVRDRLPWLRWVDLCALLVALAVGTAMLTMGIEAVVAGAGSPMRAFPFFMFATVGLLGAAGDVRVMRGGVLRGPARLARHLWRMCFALFIAALSFSVQLAKLLPRPVRFRGLLVLPVLLVLLTMFYWLWRVRRRGALRSMVPIGTRTPERA